MSNEYVQRVITCFSAYRNEQQAIPMQNYMKNHFAFLGIKKPVLTQLTKELLKEIGLPTPDQFQEVVKLLWELPEREYQYFALGLYDKRKKQLRQEDIPFLEHLITTKSWWDTVDYIAPHLFGSLFLKQAELTDDSVRQWLKSDNVWLHRTAILFQLKYKEKTDQTRLFTIIEWCAGSNEFFIRKAIGWALREYSKTNPEAVLKFVETHSLAPLSEREALKNLCKEKVT